MSKRILIAASIGALALGNASPALAVSKFERTQNAHITKAQKTATAAAKAARSAKNSANSVGKSIKSLTSIVSSLATTLGALGGQVNTYGMVSPELGVITVYAGNGPPTPSSPATPLSPIGTVWSAQIPRGGNNAADATGTALYNCTGPSANPSAGCDVRLRAAIRTTRASSDVSGSVGGGFVITGISTTGTNDATGAYAAARTGDGTTTTNDSVAPVAFSSTAPTNNDGSLLTFTPGLGHLVGIEADHSTIHLQNPGLYEIQGTLQFADAK